MSYCLVEAGFDVLGFGSHLMNGEFIRHPKMRSAGVLSPKAFEQGDCNDSKENRTIIASSWIDP